MRSLCRRWALELLSTITVRGRDRFQSSANAQDAGLGEFHRRVRLAVATSKGGLLAREGSLPEGSRPWQRRGD